jgi:hypothetical protein
LDYNRHSSSVENPTWIAKKTLEQIHHDEHKIKTRINFVDRENQKYIKKINQAYGVLEKLKSVK